MAQEFRLSEQYIKRKLRLVAPLFVLIGIGCTIPMIYFVVKIANLSPPEFGESWLWALTIGLAAFITALFIMGFIQFWKTYRKLRATNLRIEGTEIEFKFAAGTVRFDIDDIENVTVSEINGAPRAMAIQLSKTSHHFLMRRVLLLGFEDLEGIRNAFASLRPDLVVEYRARPTSSIWRVFLVRLVAVSLIIAVLSLFVALFRYPDTTWKHLLGEGPFMWCFLGIAFCIGIASIILRPFKRLGNPAWMDWQIFAVTIVLFVVILVFRHFDSMMNLAH